MFSLRHFPVNVRRRNSETETVYLGESRDEIFNLMHELSGAELERFVDSEYPQFDKSWINTGFEFDIKRLGGIEGIIEPEPLVSKRQVNIDENYSNTVGLGSISESDPPRWEKGGIE